MRKGLEDYESGEQLPEARSEIQKIQDEIRRIQSMINDMEAKAAIHMPLTQGDALLKVIDKEKANLAKKREELTRLILEAEKAGDEKYIVKKPEKEVRQEFWVEPADMINHMDANDRKLDRKEKGLM